MWAVGELTDDEFEDYVIDDVIMGDIGCTKPVAVGRHRRDAVTMPAESDYHDEVGDYFAKNVDSSAYNAHTGRPAMLALAGNVTGLKILDVGCGAGHYAAELLATPTTSPTGPANASGSPYASSPGPRAPRASSSCTGVGKSSGQSAGA
ncbi:hypothetical protein ACGFXB_45700 [Streptomyces canus]|uniref:hypothetical protein n=1 Tax=Streptomyces canus TaxID=58343 RepID=UPI00371D2177